MAGGGDEFVLCVIQRYKCRDIGNNPDCVKEFPCVVPHSRRVGVSPDRMTIATHQRPLDLIAINFAGDQPGVVPDGFSQHDALLERADALPDHLVFGIAEHGD